MSPIKCTDRVETRYRPCFCEEGGLIPRAPFPIRVFGGRVLSSTAPGDQLLRRSENRTSIARIRFPSRRREATGGGNIPPIPPAEDRLERFYRSGSNLATIMRAGGWNPGGYKAYLDFQKDGGINLKNIPSPSPASTLRAALMQRGLCPPHRL